MANQNQVSLVKKLLQRTNEALLPWETVVSRSGNQFQVSIGDVTVRIREKGAQFGEPDYVISVIDGTGSTIDSFSDVELKNEAGFDDAFVVMKELYRKAVRIASGSDRLLKELLSDLDKLGR